LQTAHLLAAAPDFQDDLDHIINVALGIDTAWDGEPHQVHFGGITEHEGADFHAADAALQVEFAGQSYAGKLLCRDVGEERAGVNINGVAAWGLHNGDARGGNVIAKVSGGGNAVAQIILVQRFLQAHGDGFQISAGQPAIGRIAFRENEQVLLLLR
jgi:hypothetical protein